MKAGTDTRATTANNQPNLRRSVRQLATSLKLHSIWQAQDREVLLANCDTDTGARRTAKEWARPGACGVSVSWPMASQSHARI